VRPQVNCWKIGVSSSINIYRAPENGHAPTDGFAEGKPVTNRFNVAPQKNLNMITSHS
jgi:hypothetical protein